MSLTRHERVERQLQSLLREHDFEVRGKDVWTRRIGFMPARPFGMTCRSIMDAAERLIPIIHSDEYHRRHNSIVEACQP